MINSAEKVYKELLENFKSELDKKLASYINVLNEILLFSAEGLAGTYTGMVSNDGKSYGETKSKKLAEKKDLLEKELNIAIGIYQSVYSGKERIIKSLEVSCREFNVNIKNIISMIGTEDYMVAE